MQRRIEMVGDMPTITLGTEWRGDAAQIRLMPTYRPDDGTTLDGTATDAHPYAYCMLYEQAYAHVYQEAESEDGTSAWFYIGGWRCGPNDSLGWMEDRVAPFIPD